MNDRHLFCLAPEPVSARQWLERSYPDVLLALSFILLCLTPIYTSRSSASLIICHWKLLSLCPSKLPYFFLKRKKIGPELCHSVLSFEKLTSWFDAIFYMMKSLIFKREALLKAVCFNGSKNINKKHEASKYLSNNFLIGNALIHVLFSSSKLQTCLAFFHVTLLIKSCVLFWLFVLFHFEKYFVACTIELFERWVTQEDFLWLLVCVVIHELIKAQPWWLKQNCLLHWDNRRPSSQDRLSCEAKDRGCLKSWEPLFWVHKGVLIQCYSLGKLWLCTLRTCYHTPVWNRLILSIAKKGTLREFKEMTL